MSQPIVEHSVFYAPGCPNFTSASGNALRRMPHKTPSRSLSVRIFFTLSSDSQLMHPGSHHGMYWFRFRRVLSLNNHRENVETSCGFVLLNHSSILLLQYPQGHWSFQRATSRMERTITQLLEGSCGKRQESVK